MIVITRSKDRIKMRGHANHAPMGQDIVCAAVSVLIQTLVQSVQELTQDTIEYDMQPGTVDIKFWNLSEQSRVLLDSFFIGIAGVQGVHPECVKVIDQA